MTISSTIYRNEQTNTVTVIASYEDAESSDFCAAYLFDGAFLTGVMVDIPSNNGANWIIHFDYENESPEVSAYFPTSNAVCYICQCPCLAQGEGSGELGNKSFDGYCVKCTPGTCNENCCQAQEVDCGTGNSPRGTSVIYRLLTFILIMFIMW